MQYCKKTTFLHWCHIETCHLIFFSVFFIFFLLSFLFLLGINLVHNSRHFWIIYRQVSVQMATWLVPFCRKLWKHTSTASFREMKRLTCRKLCTTEQHMKPWKFWSDPTYPSCRLCNLKRRTLLKKILMLGKKIVY